VEIDAAAGSVSPEGGSVPRPRSNDNPWSWKPLLRVGIPLAVLGVVLVVVGSVNTPSTKRNDLWFEVARSGIQLLAVTLAGFGVTAVLKSVDEKRARTLKEADEERARRQRDDQLRLDILQEILVCYAQVKGVRRELRAIGLRLPASEPEQIVPLGDEEVKAWRAQMTLLIKAQLAIETIKRHLQERRLFTQNDKIAAELKDVEQYLNEGLGECNLKTCSRQHGRVISEWQKIGWRVRAPVDGATVMRFKHLGAFIGTTKDSFGPKVADKLDEIVKDVREEVYGGPPPD
jgi:hypothetical protein